MNIEHCKCELCGSDNYTVIWDKQAKMDMGWAYKYVIKDEKGKIVQGRNVICNVCGLVYINPRMTKESLTEFYRDSYRDIYNTSPFESEVLHAKSAWKVIHQVLKPDKGKLLDIGCSRGAMLGIARNNSNLEVYGIEPDTDYSKAAENYGKVFNGVVEDYFGRDFDIITMLNTLEHMYSPIEVLKKVHTLLSPAGRFVVIVPNFANNHINTSMDGWFSNAHLFSFMPQTLEGMLVKCGLYPVYGASISESVGQKIVFVCKKGKPRDIEYLKPDLQSIQARITASEILASTFDRLYLKE